jgi:putative DNA primase/helicase
MEGNLSLMEYLVRALGYCLTGSVSEQIFFIAHGAGQNGKGVLMRAMTRLMGSYAVSLNPDSLMHKLIPTVPADIASLHGARWVPVFETDSRRGFSEVILKQLTGGDPITARRLHQNFFTFHPKFKLFISSNELPEMRNFDFAIRRRLHLIPFNWQAVDRDDHLDQKLAAEMPGILRLLVEALGEYREIGMRPPDEVLEAVRNYQADNDSLGQFIDERCELDENFCVAASAIHSAYNSWAKVNHAPELSGYHFSKKMEKRGFRKTTPQNIKTYMGIALKDRQGGYGVD